MKKLDIVVDLDGVCADFIGAYSPQGLVPIYNRLSGEGVQIEDFRTWDMKGAVKRPELLTHIFHAPGFFRHLEPIEGSVWALRSLMRRGHDVLIATSGCTPHAFGEKAEWCQEHFPFIPLSRICLIHRKSQLRGDVMIDDGPHNTKAFRDSNPGATTISMAWPYNQPQSEDFTALVGDWKKPFASWVSIVNLIDGLDTGGSE